MENDSDFSDDCSIKKACDSEFCKKKHIGTCIQCDFCFCEDCINDHSCESDFNEPIDNQSQSTNKRKRPNSTFGIRIGDDFFSSPSKQQHLPISYTNSPLFNSDVTPEHFNNGRTIASTPSRLKIQRVRIKKAKTTWSALRVFTTKADFDVEKIEREALQREECKVYMSSPFLHVFSQSQSNGMFLLDFSDFIFISIYYF